jgi:hypothetical protein
LPSRKPGTEEEEIGDGKKLKNGMVGVCRKHVRGKK